MEDPIWEPIAHYSDGELDLRTHWNVRKKAGVASMRAVCFCSGQLALPDFLPANARIQYSSSTSVFSNAAGARLSGGNQATHAKSHGLPCKQLTDRRRMLRLRLLEAGVGGICKLQETADWRE